MCATFLPVCLCISVSLCPCVSVFVFLSVAPCVCLSLFVFMLLRVGSTFSNGEPWPSTDCRFYLPPSANVPVTPALHGAQSATNYDQEKKTCAISGCSLSRKHLSTQEDVNWPVCSPSKFDHQTPLSCPCFLQVHAWGLQPAAAVNYLIRNWLLRRTCPPGSCGCTAQPRFNQ